MNSTLDTALKGRATLQASRETLPGWFFVWQSDQLLDQQQ
jgi:hypothetical protein